MGNHHTEPEFAEEVITKQTSQVSTHRMNTFGTEALDCYRRFFLSSKSVFLNAYLSNLTCFWKFFTLKGLVVSILGTKVKLIPCVFQSFWTLLQGHRGKKTAPNYPTRVAVTYLLYSQDLPNSYHVPGTITLFQIVIWNWWPDGSSRVIAGKLVLCLHFFQGTERVSRNTQLKMALPSHCCYFLMAACLCYICITKKSTQESLLKEHSQSGTSQLRYYNHTEHLISLLNPSV